MGTRFLLTSDSTVPDSVKQRYLAADLSGTVVSTRVDDMPHRVLRTELVKKLESGLRTGGFTAAIRNAAKFKKMSGMSWPTMVRDGLAMRHGKELTWSQMLMAANTPMLLKAVLRGADRGHRRRGRRAPAVGVEVHSVAPSGNLTTRHTEMAS